MKKLALLSLFAFLLAFVTSGFATSLAPTAVAQQAENRVGAQFSTSWIYDSPENVFTNGEVTGRNEWHANIGRGVPLTGLALTLDSTLNFDHFQKENLTTTGPPTYLWSFGDVPPGTNSVAYVGLGSLDSPDATPVTFTPGFDASRSADKTEFSEPGTQSLTITVTPREGTEGFDILVQAFEDHMANPVITSPTSGDGIQLSPDGHSLHISPTGLELNTTWSTTVTIQVVPKLPEIQYIPDVLIECYETVVSGTTSGSFISYPVGDPADGVGTWTWSAEGSYVWYWAADESPPKYGVGWGPRATQEPTPAPVPTPTPTPAPGPTPTPSQAFSWQIVIGIAAGIVIIIGLVIYFFIVRRVTK